MLEVNSNKSHGNQDSRVTQAILDLPPGMPMSEDAMRTASHERLLHMVRRVIGVFPGAWPVYLSNALQLNATPFCARTISTLCMRALKDADISLQFHFGGSTTH